jgi:hypothetical protein
VRRNAFIAFIQIVALQFRDRLPNHVAGVISTSAGGPASLIEESSTPLVNLQDVRFLTSVSSNFKNLSSTSFGPWHDQPKIRKPR